MISGVEPPVCFKHRSPIFPFERLSREALPASQRALAAPRDAAFDFRVYLPVQANMHFERASFSSKMSTSTPYSYYHIKLFFWFLYVSMYMRW